MTKKDFFRILIKTFGLYSLIVAVFTVFPSQFSFVLSDFGYIGFLYILVMLLFIVLVFLFLIRKPDIIIHLLKLERGFDDERIDFKYLKTSCILKLSAIVIGGLLMIDNVPIVLSHAYFAFKSDMSGHGLNDRQYISWGVSFVNLIIGYLLVTNFEKISTWFKNNEETESKA